jgi:hypothetical protein
MNNHVDCHAGGDAQQSSCSKEVNSITAHDFYEKSWNEPASGY